MNNTTTRDLLVGTFVLVALGAVGWLSVTVGGLGRGAPGGLPVFAKFDQISGLKSRAPVLIAGVKVGQVIGISLGDDFRARVDMDLSADLELPIDSSASVVTAGLLGDRYISLDIGAENQLIAPGEEIAYTNSALVLENIIGKFLYNVGGEDKK